MSGFNYSKWDNIELSDDEDDCHPNIDKQSWFRMKHRSRVEREAREETEKEGLDKANKQDQARIEELVTKMAEEDDDDDRDALEAEMHDLEQAISKREGRLAEMEKNKKWNVDNMCHVVEERTMIGSKKDTLTTAELPPDLAAVQASREAARSAAAAAESSSSSTSTSSTTTKKAAATKPVAGPVSERSSIDSYSDFVGKHEQLLEDYSAIQSMEETQKMLHGKGDILLQENATSYLLLSCLEEEMNGNRNKMKHVARQSQILSHITELAVSLRRPPRDVVIPFFRRISEPEHGQSFKEAVDLFISRIQKRAIDKKKEMAEEAARKKELGIEDEEEEVELSKEERMGPGGLDPVEVFESLPEALQAAFQSQDTQQLKDAIAKMPIEEAKYHMKRCEDSGLWVSEK